MLAFSLAFFPSRTPINCSSVMWLLAEAKHLAHIWLLKSSTMPAAMKMKELENDIHGEVNSNHRGSRKATHKTPCKNCEPRMTVS